MSLRDLFTRRSLRNRPGAAMPAVIAAVQDAILTVDSAGLVTSINPAAEQLFGWPAAALVGRSWMTLRASDETVDERELFHRAAALMLETGTTADSTFQSRDGSPLELEFSISPLDDGMVVIARDVRAQRQAADQVREQSQRLAALASAQSQIAVGGHSPQATMELIGAAVCRLVGASGAAVLQPDGEWLVARAGVGITSHWVGSRVPVSGSLAGSAYRVGQLASATGEPLSSEPIITHGEGIDAGVRTLLAVPLREGGTPTGVLLVAHSSEQAFDDRDLRLLELFSGMAASVLHRSQVEHSLAVTHAVAQAASVDATLDSGLSGALRVLTGRLGWEAAAIWLEADDQDGALTCAAQLIDAGLPAQQLQDSFGRQIDRGSASPAWAAFAGRETIWIDLTRDAADPRTLEHVTSAGLACAVYVPLRSHGRAIGVIELLQRRPHSHDAAELGLLEAVAAQVANFVARRVAEAQMSAQTEHLAAIVALSQQLASVPVSQVRQALCEAALSMTRSDTVVLYEPDGQGGLVVTGQAGHGELPTAPAPIATTLAGETLRSRRGRFLSSEDVGAAPGDELVARTELRSAHLEPVMREGEGVALLALASRNPRSRQAPGFAEFAQLLASEAATTLALADLVRALDARARTDELTGLANRRTWDEELPRELARSKRAKRPVSVAMLDLDHFKKYNDTYGHPAGDRLLRAVAAGWGSRLRETDLLARYGGEEFGVVLPDCDIEAAQRVLDELRLCMPDGSTCSIGVACWDGEESPEDLVQRADGALYEAKRGGRDRITPAQPV